jgi:hypothetical protein
LFFHITFVSMLGFMHLWPSCVLEILITCSLSSEIVSIIREDSVVTKLKYYFSPLDWRKWLSSQEFFHMFRVPGLVPSTAQTKVN